MLTIFHPSIVDVLVRVSLLLATRKDRVQADAVCQLLCLVTLSLLFLLMRMTKISTVSQKGMLSFDDLWNWPLLHQVQNIHPNGKALKSTLQGLLLLILKRTFWSKTSGLLSTTPESRAPVSSPALTLHISDCYQCQKPEYFSCHNK